SILIHYAVVKGLGIHGIYRQAGDTLIKFNTDRPAGMKTGIFYPPNSEHQFGADVARSINDTLLRVAPEPADKGQTPVLLDFEPSYGSTQFWQEFISTYRALRPGRVTDFTREPFKATELPAQDRLNA